MKIKILLANFLKILHIIFYIPTIIIPVGIIFSFIPVNINWLKYAMFIILLILLDWNDYDGYCSITALEAKLRGTYKPKKIYGYNKGFFTNILKGFNIKMNGYTTEKLSYFILLIIWMILYMSFLKIQKISLFDTKNIGWIGKLMIAIIIICLIIYFINLCYK